MAALARIFAREAAQRVASESLRWLRGAGGVPDAELAGFTRALEMPAIEAAQAGLIQDMDEVADALYGRESAAG
jgi:hypothetical protein